VLLREYVNRFAGPIQTIGARPALYSVWPSRGRQGDFARAIESYTIAASDVNALLFPVATAWLAAWRRDSSIVLYELDGLHPSVLGSYVAALVMYGVISGKTPIGLPPQLRLRDGRLVNVPVAVATILQQAADEAIRGSQ
jgi:hypothetical protein